jgi:hypothetical protein
MNLLIADTTDTCLNGGIVSSGAMLLDTVVECRDGRVVEAIWLMEMELLLLRPSAFAMASHVFMSAYIVFLAA